MLMGSVRHHPSRWRGSVKAKGRNTVEYTQYHRSLPHIPSSTSMTDAHRPSDHLNLAPRHPRPEERIPHLPLLFHPTIFYLFIRSSRILSSRLVPLQALPPRNNSTTYKREERIDEFVAEEGNLETREELGLQRTGGPGGAGRGE